MIEVIPAILPRDIKDIREKFGKVSGLVRKVQVDIVDGQYAPAKTWPFIEKNNDDVLNIVRGNLEFPYIENFNMELDMLVLHPIEYIPDFLSIGFKSFVIHIDSTDHVRECVDTIKNAGCKVGIGIKPSISIEILEPYIFDVDFIQCMGNDKIGFSGVELDEQVLQKTKSIKSRHPSVPIQVDIGVNLDTAPRLIKAGVTGLVSNSTIFNAPNIKEAIMNLRKN